jgi:transcriptional regulator with XRE-family HTH domain
MNPTPEQRQAFGELVRTARRNGRMSQRTLAGHLDEMGFDVSGSAVGGWERGEYAPSSAPLVLAIADTLGVDRTTLVRSLGSSMVVSADEDELEDIGRRIAYGIPLDDGAAAAIETLDVTALTLSIVNSLVDRVNELEERLAAAPIGRRLSDEEQERLRRAGVLRRGDDGVGDQSQAVANGE